MRKNFTALMFAIALFFTAYSNAFAATCPPCAGCVAPDCDFAKEVIEFAHMDGREDLASELADDMTEYRNWFVNDFFLEFFLPATKMWAQEEVTTAQRQILSEMETRDAGIANFKNKQMNKVTKDANKIFNPQKNGNSYSAIIATATSAILSAGAATGGLTDSDFGRVIRKQITKSNKEPLGTPASDKVSEAIYEEWAKNCNPQTSICPSTSVANPKDSNYLSEGILALIGSNTIPKSEFSNVVSSLSIGCAPLVDTPPVSAAELKRSPSFKFLNLTNEAWTSVVAESCSELATLRMEPPRTALDPKSQNVMANYQGNDDLVCLRTDCGADPSFLTMMDAVSMSMVDTKNLTLTAGDSAENNQRAMLSAGILNNIIKYEIYKSQQRQEMLVAGILMYEIMEHKRWREENNALKIAKNGGIINASLDKSKEKQP